MSAGKREALATFGGCVVDPASLRVGRGSYDAALALYAEHRERLVWLCDEMARIRAAMLARGHSADFSDREAELLYLLIRQARPDTVVEISPRHGYTTNYILAALTDNGHGQLWSYEIAQHEQGVPTEKVIRGNLSRHVEQERLTVVLGDARDAAIPAADVLFIDSCHEAYFAAWYLDELVSRAGIVFVHDILVDVGAGRALVPKAALFGVREQYYLLQALHENRIPFFSVAHFGARQGESWQAGRAARFTPENSDRSIVFPGHSQSPASRLMHDQMGRVYRAAHEALEGDRLGSLEACRGVIEGEGGSFLKLVAAHAQTLMGYRRPTAPEMFEPIALGSEPTVSEVVAAMELALDAANPALHRYARRAARKSGLEPRARDFLLNGYRDLGRGAAAGPARKLLRRIPWGLR